MFFHHSLTFKATHIVYIDVLRHGIFETLEVSLLALPIQTVNTVLEIFVLFPVEVVNAHYMDANLFVVGLFPWLRLCHG